MQKDDVYNMTFYSDNKPGEDNHHRRVNTQMLASSSPAIEPVDWQIVNNQQKRVAQPITVQNSQQLAFDYSPIHGQAPSRMNLSSGISDIDYSQQFQDAQAAQQQHRIRSSNIQQSNQSNINISRHNVRSVAKRGSHLDKSDNSAETPTASKTTMSKFMMLGAGGK